MVTERIIKSKQEMADELGISIKNLEMHLRKYPFKSIGVTGMVNGRWKPLMSQLLAWWDFVLQQESRHPDARRLRPEEPPDLQKIQGR